MALTPITAPIARFEASSISQGQNVDRQNVLSQFKQLFSAKTQLAVYNSANHQHIASGVSKTQFSQLTCLDPSKGLSSAHLASADKILDAAGIAHNHLGAADKLSLAVMAARDPERAADIAQLKSAGLDAPQMMDPKMRHSLAELSRQDAAAATMVSQIVAAGKDVTAFLYDLVDISKHSPNLTAKIATLGQQEIAGTVRDGSVDYIVSRAKEDPYMRDLSSGLDPATLPTAATLGFDPKFHIKLDQAKFQEVSTALQRLQADGILTDIATDQATGTVHCGYSYATFNDIVMGLAGTQPRPDGTLKQMDANQVKGALTGAAAQRMFALQQPVGVLSPSLEMEHAFGNPTLSAQRQQTRFDAVLDMFEKYQDFDYTNHDAAFTTAALTTLQAGVTGKPDHQKIQEIFRSHDGFAIGESHSDVDSKKFIYNNLAALKAEGVTMIAIEHLKHHEFADMVDAYMQTPPGTPMSEDLRLALKNIDRGQTGAESITGIVTKIHDDPACRGIRLVGADTENLNASKSAVHGMEIRMGNMNTFAESNIRSVLQPGDKFVILAGAAHNNTHVGLSNGMPGFSQAFGIPAFKVAADGAGGFDMTIDHEDKTARTAATLQRPAN